MIISLAVIACPRAGNRDEGRMLCQRNESPLLWLAAIPCGFALSVAPVLAQDAARTVPEPGHVARAQEASTEEDRTAATTRAITRYARGEKADAMPQLVRAAEEGDARARYLVGLAHFNGDLLPRDWPRAYALVLLAAEAGLRPADGALARMAGYLSPDERSEGEALAHFLDASGASSDPPRVPPADGSAIVTGSKEGPTLRLGAFSDPANAARLRERLARDGILREARVEVAQLGGLTLVNARGFASVDAAKRACDALQREGVECLIMR